MERVAFSEAVILANTGEALSSSVKAERTVATSASSLHVSICELLSFHLQRADQ